MTTPKFCISQYKCKHVFSFCFHTCEHDFKEYLDLLHVAFPFNLDNNNPHHQHPSVWAAFHKPTWPNNTKPSLVRKLIEATVLLWLSRGMKSSLCTIKSTNELNYGCDATLYPPSWAHCPGFLDGWCQNRWALRLRQGMRAGVHCHSMVILQNKKVENPQTFVLLGTKLPTFNFFFFLILSISFFNFFIHTFSKILFGSENCGVQCAHTHTHTHCYSLLVLQLYCCTV